VPSASPVFTKTDQADQALSQPRQGTGALGRVDLTGDHADPLDIDFAIVHIRFAYLYATSLPQLSLY